MNKILEKKLIIFDVDGTLMDSENDVFISFNHVLKTNLNMEITKEKFAELAGLSLEKSFSNLMQNKDENLAKELTKKYRQYYIDEKHFLDNTTLFEGVKETLSNLKKQGFILTIATGKAQRAVDYMLQYFKLNEIDLAIGIGESNFKNKPDPEVVNHILEEFNISQEDAIIIGDSPVDILAGQNANIDTIAVSFGYDSIENLKKFNPTAVIDRFGDLNNILKYK